MTGLFAEVKSGRVFLGRLPAGGDLVTEMESVCTRHAIDLGIFTIQGAVSSDTWGVYDPSQHVYVTRTAEATHQIAVCTGNISLKSGNPFVLAQGVFSDQDGRCFGGRVFSDTRLIACEYELTELKGSPLDRNYDPETGMMLWQFPR